MKANSLECLQELLYSGSVAEKQFPTTSVVSYNSLTSKQNELFKRCLMGLNYYSKEELYAMNSAKKQKIKERNRKVQEFLNLWKQEITNLKINSSLATLFPKAQFIQDLSADFSTDKKFINTLSFKDLNVNRTQVVEKLISKGFLPRNFATL